MSLHLSDVTVTYPDGGGRLTALDQVTLDVEPGELLAVTGPSGSGKSSLLAVAGLLLTPDAGGVRVADVDTDGLGGRQRTRLRREKLGFVFQQSNLVASLTAVEQLLAVAHLAGRRKAGQERKARELLAAVGLDAHLHKRPHQLSGGERQRVGIARSLMNDPAVLLVDEPTSALDAERGHAIVELLRTVTSDHSLATVMVTHELAYLDLVTASAEMHDGTLRIPEPV
ncbi:MAG: ABC transporter ATP-binding protein [Nocardioidaceae bacterium]